MIPKFVNKNLIFPYLIVISLFSIASMIGNPVWAWQDAGAPLDAHIQMSASPWTTGSITVYTGQTVNFRAVDSYGSPVSNLDIDSCSGLPSIDSVFYYWNFGDSSTEYQANSTGHSYASISTYRVTLAARDMGLCYDDPNVYDYATVFVISSDTSSSAFNPLQAHIQHSLSPWTTGNIQNVKTGQEIKFRAVDSDGNPACNIDYDNCLAHLAIDSVYYYWDFGDGTPIVQANSISHTYRRNGTFTVTLTAKDIGLCYKDPDVINTIRVHVFLRRIDIIRQQNPVKR